MLRLQNVTYTWIRFSDAMLVTNVTKFTSISDVHWALIYFCIGRNVYIFENMQVNNVTKHLQSFLHVRFAWNSAVIHSLQVFYDVPCKNYIQELIRMYTVALVHLRKSTMFSTIFGKILDYRSVHQNVQGSSTKTNFSREARLRFVPLGCDSSPWVAFRPHRLRFVPKQKGTKRILAVRSLKQLTKEG